MVWSNNFYNNNNNNNKKKKKKKKKKKAQGRKYPWIPLEQYSKNTKLENLGLDGIHGFWFKKFTFIHDRLAIEMNRYLQEIDIPEWITKGMTTLIQKDPWKGTALNKYRPITDDVKNTNGTKWGRDLLLVNKPWTVPRGT